MINGAIITDHGSFTNHDTKSVIDKNATTNLCAGMDFDAGQDSAKMRNQSTKPVQPYLPKPVGQAVRHQSVQARIARDDFKFAARCRIAFQNAVDVFAYFFKHNVHRSAEFASRSH